MDSPKVGIDDNENTIFVTPPRTRDSPSLNPREVSQGQLTPFVIAQTDNSDMTDSFDDVDLNAQCGEDTPARSDVLDNLDSIDSIGLSFDDHEEPLDTSGTEHYILEFELPSSNKAAPKPFEKWVRTLHKRATSRRKIESSEAHGSSIGDGHQSMGLRRKLSSKLRKSASGSSLGFVTAVKSASVSFASFSAAPRSRRTTGRSSKYQRTDRSSRGSITAARASEDSSYLARGVINDAAVTNRAIRRRRVLEEIISTEESYVGDIRFLMNVYITLLASIPTLSVSLRSSINRNLNEIVELHDDLLGDLHRVVPHSEYTQKDYIVCSPPPLPGQGHQRWRSLDAVPENTDDLSWIQKIPGLTAEAPVAAEVARAFGRRMHRFFAYEEYGAKYEMMVKDVASTYKTMPQWDEYQKGLEALGASLASINTQTEQPKKSLTVGDLLVKPIQRVCRYPLLFAELLRQTPVCDCPDSHIEIEKVLSRMRETTAEINKATDDPRMKATLEKTWLIQDRLVFPDQADPSSKSMIRTFGHIHLCGVLHAAWQTRDSVDSQYMITLLYRDCLVLATTGKWDQVYTVQATIWLSDIRVEDADNGRGMQCHTAPFSWKLVFECDHQLYEIILSACSPKEELEWRTRLIDRAGREHIDGAEPGFFTSMSLGIRSLGTVFGKPGTVARRLSIHRATTVGPKSPLCQVIIKNTSSLKEAAHSTAATAAINRSQSLLSTNRIPVIAPSRAERIRLENLLSDVWTRQILPFPGMAGRLKSEHLVRASASSMMRKLSVASITSNFKRSGSLASMTSLQYRPSDEHSDHAASTQLERTNVESHIRKSSSRMEPEESHKPHLSAINDDSPHVQQRTPAQVKSTSEESPVATVKRLATLRVKKIIRPDANREITPPHRTPSAGSNQQVAGQQVPGALRTASGSSLNQIRASPVSDTSFESVENQYPQRHHRWHKGSGLHVAFSAEGIKGFFT